jgi:hypothetical protein
LLFRSPSDKFIKKEALHSKLNATSEADEHGIDPLVLSEHIHATNVYRPRDDDHIVDAPAKNTFTLEHNLIKHLEILGQELCW